MLQLSADFKCDLLRNLRDDFIKSGVCVFLKRSEEFKRAADIALAKDRASGIFQLPMNFERGNANRSTSGAQC